MFSLKIYLKKDAEGNALYAEYVSISVLDDASTCYVTYSVRNTNFAIEGHRLNEMDTLTQIAEMVKQDYLSREENV